MTKLSAHLLQGMLSPLMVPSVNVFTIGATWINFDGVETIQAKIAYAKEKKLLGYNAFQLSNADNWALSLAASAEKENQENRRRLLLTILLPITSVFILTACMICYFQRKVIKIKVIQQISIFII
ncbi:hypothetical protein Pint_14636 [Pistacia integerrima]|uniref:Uncharacterized protein n=1 Tax=Pistacia integerrima TaxID=434235 RepID=A0ACC0YAB8_9ROSI|nr:hypothetical protein Pint_14636 [Pistacia integerrima]